MEIDKNLSDSVLNLCRTATGINYIDYEQIREKFTEINKQNEKETLKKQRKNRFNNKYLSDKSFYVILGLFFGFLAGIMCCNIFWIIVFNYI